MVISVIFFSTPVGASDPVPNVYFVDSAGSNFLFRGARPLIEEKGSPVKFNYKGLYNAIVSAGEKAGVTVPSNFTLIDVSLMWVDNPDESALIFAEYSFFKSYPELGQLHYWMTKGAKLSPADPLFAASRDYRDYLAADIDSWLDDPLVFRVSLLREWLENPSKLGVTGPIVIYVHCYGGCDRTGELIGSYYLRYKNKSWEEVRALNGERCRPDRGYETDQCNALQWYGLWLNLKFGRSLHWDSIPPCPTKRP